MTDIFIDIILLILAYLLGSIPFGLVLTRLFSTADIRRQGSGNIGATNVARVAGPGLGIGTLLADILKGLLPVLLVLAIKPGADSSVELLSAGVALAAVIGHMFPVYSRFKRGGKGVATTAGAFFGHLRLGDPDLIYRFRIDCRFYPACFGCIALCRTGAAACTLGDDRFDRITAVGYCRGSTDHFPAPGQYQPVDGRYRTPVQDKAGATLTFPDCIFSDYIIREPASTRIPTSTNWLSTMNSSRIPGSIFPCS